MHLKTGRLQLRLLTPTDIPSLIELWTNPEVTRYMGGPRDAAKLQQGFTEDLNNPIPETYDLWPVIETSTGQVVGHCGLLAKEIDHQPELELIYLIVQSAWGQGYATEITLALKQYAVEQLKLSRLVALIDPHNTASERVALKVGLQFEKMVTRPGGKVMKLYAVNTIAASKAFPKK